jgi:hypothetical protein
MASRSGITAERAVAASKEIAKLVVLRENIVYTMFGKEMNATRKPRR